MSFSNFFRAEDVSDEKTLTDSSRQEPGDRALHPEWEERGDEDEELHRPGRGVALHD